MSVNTAVTDVMPRGKKAAAPARGTSVQAPAGAVVAPRAGRGRQPEMIKLGKVTLPLADARSDAKKAIGEAKANVKSAKAVLKDAEGKVKVTNKVIEGARKDLAKHEASLAKAPKDPDLKQFVKNGKGAIKDFEKQLKADNKAVDAAKKAVDKAEVALKKAEDHAASVEGARVPKVA